MELAWGSAMTKLNQAGRQEVEVLGLMSGLEPQLLRLGRPSGGPTAFQTEEKHGTIRVAGAASSCFSSLVSVMTHEATAIDHSVGSGPWETLFPRDGGNTKNDSGRSVSSTPPPPCCRLGSPWLRTPQTPQGPGHLQTGETEKCCAAFEVTGRGDLEHRP